ncbi:MAG: CPXCG motif-containing cysteine-rich protein [Chthoniobacterales bacterium]
MNLISVEEVFCPYCGETFTLNIDTSQGIHSTIEDCTVCCRPIAFQIDAEPGEVLSIETKRA